MVSSDREAYLVYFKRTAFTRVRRNDLRADPFYPVRADELLSLLIRKAIDDTGIRPQEIDDVIVGCALQVYENWTFGGRIPVLLAELPPEVPSMAIDRQCGSSLNAIGIGAMEIMSGNADIVIAGGMEHMSRVPMGDNPHISPNTALLTDPRYAKYDMATGFFMGLTAEKLASLKGITREEADKFSLRSHRLAARALEEGYFRGEILPVTVERDGELIVVDRDQNIRPDTSLEQLSKLPPAFKPGGMVTAGNSSPMSTGASLVVLMSGRKVREYGIKPLSKVVSMGWAGVDPSIMGEGIVPASRKALSRANLKPEDIDYWEINEAFAVVVINAMRSLGIEEDRVNVKGGAIAIGHPLGATGARLAGTLSRILNEKGKEFGLATACIGGGQGYALILQRA